MGTLAIIADVLDFPTPRERVTSGTPGSSNF